MKQILLIGLMCMLAMRCGKSDKSETVSTTFDGTIFETENLIIKKVTDHVYQHISFLNTESFGRVECNGMIVTNGNEAIVFDTPTDDLGSVELLDYLAKQNAKVTAIIATHFHADCVGGLQEFHTRGIPSYANNLTIQLIKEKAEGIAPQNGFDQELELHVGGKPVTTTFYGSGHTRDNVVAYFPDEQTLFGGCLVKEIKASKGYLGDADTVAWSDTMLKIRMKYPDLKIVIPGHGKPGGAELLDYTAQLFQVKNHP
ncbi:MAG: subclass B1 metallo-beta-lactamase [Cyclobacteriaceae bacterium]|nr:subclass B1 metallo-beta-lactamase [Cyclobacteriaceae bacterium]